ERVSQVRVVRQVPYLAMKREVRFVEQREVYGNGRLFHTADGLPQTVKIFFRNVFFGPLDRQRLQFYAQTKYPLDISWAELCYGSSLVRRALNKPLMLEFYQRFTNQRNAGA